MRRRKHFEWSLVSLDIPFRCILIAITTIKTNVLNFDHDKRVGLEFFSSSYIAQISFHYLSDRCCLGKKFQPSQQLTKTKHVFQSCIQYFKNGRLINYIQNVYTIVDYRQFTNQILRIKNIRLPSNAPSNGLNQQPKNQHSARKHQHHLGVSESFLPNKMRVTSQWKPTETSLGLTQYAGKHISLFTSTDSLFTQVPPCAGKHISLSMSRETWLHSRTPKQRSR